MHRKRTVIAYGFAIFSMFFGSGNLVFPLEIGLFSSSAWITGFFGLFLTGILIPVLGLFAIKIHKGSYLDFFGEAGSLARHILPFFILAIICSFGIIPRCITVAHGGIGYLFPDFSLKDFSLIFCAILFIFCLKEHLMIKAMGKWVSPLLLITIIAIIACGIYMDGPTQLPVEHTKVFMHGFITGYQTMDLFGAFFIAALVFKQIQERMPDNTSDREIIRYAIKPSVIGAALLASVYLGFVFLGAKYGSLFEDTPSESLIAAIAYHTMGKSGGFFIAVAVVLACLTTALALNSIYAHYLMTTFKIKQNYLPMLLFVITAIAFFISLFDFQGIVNFLSPILVVTYPAFIALTVLTLLTRKKLMLKKITFYGITLFMVLSLIIN